MNNGKLITVWNLTEEKMGCTTTTIGISTVLSWWFRKNTLLSSFAKNGKMDLYLSQNIILKYNLDNLKVFKNNITSDEIKIHTTAINDKLDAIGDYTLDTELVDFSEDFTFNFINESLKIYDYVVLDVSNNMSKDILDKSDIVLALLPFEDQFLKQIYSGEVSNYMEDKKVIPLFSKLPLGLENELSNILSKYNIETYKYLPVNKYVHYTTSITYDFYDFIVENIPKTKEIYVEELVDLVLFILDKTKGLEGIDDFSKKSILSRLFKKRTS